MNEKIRELLKIKDELNTVDNEPFYSNNRLIVTHKVLSRLITFLIKQEEEKLK